MSRHLAAIGLMGALALAWPAAAQEKQPKAGGSVVFGIGGDPTILNRNISTSNQDGLIACAIYQGLTEVRPNGDVAPLLAKSWTVSPDGLRYEFELHAARWHDGKPFTSEDVKFTIEEVAAKFSTVFAAAARQLQSVETPAPDRVVVTLKQPYGPFLLSLGCSQSLGILPAHLLRSTNIRTNPVITSTPVGTGAFKFDEWRRGDYVRLVKNPDYWEKGKPYLTELIAKVMPQAGSRTQSILAGEADVMNFYYFPTNDYDTVMKTGRFKLIPAAAPSTDVMTINMTRKPFDDVRVRQALFMGINRDYLMEAAYHKLGSVGTMPFTNRLTWAANPDIDYSKMYPYDIARANAMLDEAGLKRNANGVRLATTISYLSDDAEAALVAVAIKSMWKEIGVDVAITQGERAVILPKIFEPAKRDFDFALLAYASQSDPAMGYARLAVSSAIGQQYGNGSVYSNPEVDRLLTEGEGGSSNSARGVIYQKAQAILARDLPYYTLHERVLNTVVAKELMGLENEYNQQSFRNAWWDR